MDAKINKEQMSQKVIVYFGHYTRTQANHGFRQGMLQIATCFLDFMKNTFNTFTNMEKPTIECF